MRERGRERQGRDTYEREGERGNEIINKQERTNI